jgi:hypothetical protein
LKHDCDNINSIEFEIDVSYHIKCGFLNCDNNILIKAAKKFAANNNCVFVKLDNGLFIFCVFIA